MVYIPFKPTYVVRLADKVVGSNTILGLVFNMLGIVPSITFLFPETVLFINSLGTVITKFNFSQFQKVI